MGNISKNLLTMVGALTVGLTAGTVWGQGAPACLELEPTDPVDGDEVVVTATDTEGEPVDLSTLALVELCFGDAGCVDTGGTLDTSSGEGVFTITQAMLESDIFDFFAESPELDGGSVWFTLANPDFDDAPFDIVADAFAAGGACGGTTEGGGDGGDPFLCVVLDPTDPVDGTRATVTVLDQDDQIVNLSTYTIVEFCFGDGLCVTTGDGSIEINQDGEAEFTVTGEMLGRTVFDLDLFAENPPPDSTNFSALNDLDQTFDTVADAFAAGGGCRADIGPPPAFGVPVCTLLEPTDPVDGDQVTATVLDEEGQRVDLSAYDIVEFCFGDGLCVTTGDGSVEINQDGEAEFTFVEEMLDRTVFDLDLFAENPPPDHTNFSALTNEDEGLFFGAVAEVFDAGGNCGDVEPPPPLPGIKGDAERGTILSVTDVNTAAPSAVQRGGLENGAAAFVDRPANEQNWAVVPRALQGVDYIQASQDNGGQQGMQIQVEVVDGTILHLFIDNGNVGVPPFSWMNEAESGSDWRDTGEEVDGSFGETDFSVWSTVEPLSAGVYTLGNIDVQAFDGSFYGIAATFDGDPVNLIRDCVELELRRPEFNLREGDRARLAVTCIEVDGRRFDVTPGQTGTIYTSNQEGVATVDENGVLMAEGAGTAEITATNGAGSATAQVTVVAAADIIDLGDIVAGGDGSGFGGGANGDRDFSGIDLNTGDFMTLEEVADSFFVTLDEDGTNPTPVDQLDLIDVVFFMNQVEMEINSSQVQYSWRETDILENSISGILSNLTHAFEDGTTEIEVGDNQWASSVAVHSAAGITFDLEALRDTHGAEEVHTFSTFAGVGPCGSASAAVYIIYSNDEGIVDDPVVAGTDPFLLPVEASTGELYVGRIPEEATFLTLATGGANGHLDCDRIAFANPRIYSESEAPAPTCETLAPVEAPVQVALQGEEQLRFKCTDDAGLTRDVTAAATGTTYSVTPEGVIATVDEDGLATGIGVGEAEVTATHGGVSATVQVSVGLSGIQGEPISGIIVSVVDVLVNGAPSVIREGGLRNGVSGFVDRVGQQWDVVPQELIGADYIESAQDNAAPDLPLEIEVEVIEGTILHMFIDNRNGGPYEWMNEETFGSDWFDTGRDVVAGAPGDDFAPEDFSVWSTVEPLPEGVWVFREIGPVDQSFYGIAATLDVGPSDELFRRGDSNANGTLDIGDPILNLGHQFLGDQVVCRDALDYNDSGTIDISDPIANLTHQFLGGPPPEAPGIAACGLDPTVDNLECTAYPEENC